MQTEANMRLRQALAALLGFSSCFLVSFVDLLRADWPQWLGPNRDGVSGETGLVKTWSDKGPPVMWEQKVGEGYSGPVVAGQRLILFQRVGDKEVLDCLDALSGKPQWRFDYPTGYRDDFGKGDGPRSTPTISGQ